MSANSPIRVLMLTLVLGMPATMAHAQGSGSPFAGFSAQRDKPINFEADKAEVFDAEKKAVLSGNVKIVQGESTLQTKRLVIYYEDRKDGGAAGRKANLPGGASASQNVRRFEMDGGVVVSSKNQQASAESGSFDARANAALLQGNVVLSQCGNVLRGERLHADLSANRVRLEGQQGGRVSGLLNPASQNQPGCAPPAAPSAANPAAGGGSAPMSLQPPPARSGAAQKRG